MSSSFADPPVRRRTGQPTEVDSEVRRLLKDHSASALAKYRAINVGRPGLLPLLAHELRATLLAGLGGAAGIALRQLFYRGMWRRCGKGVVVGRGVTIRHPHRIELGEGVIIDDHCVLDGKGEADVTIRLGDGVILGRNTVLSCKGGSIELEAGVNVSLNCTFISESKLTIGRRTYVAGHCYAIAGGTHGMERTDIPIADQPSIAKGGIAVGADAWIGAQVAILDGVTIGHDAVVGAGAVVLHDVAPFAVAAGVPARQLRSRLG